MAVRASHLSAVKDGDEGYVVPIGEFEGWPVIKTGIEVRNAGGGLNDALEVEAFIGAIGDRVIVIHECDVIDVGFRSVKGDEGSLRRVHALRATDSFVIPSDDAERTEALSELIQQQRAKIEVYRAAKEAEAARRREERARAKEKAAGVQQLGDAPTD
jgi:hypothetical protein